MDVAIKRWYKGNVIILSKVYGTVEFDSVAYSWIYIRDFILPDCFTTKTSALLITTPMDDLMRPSGFNFYLNQNLKRNDGKPTSRLHIQNNPYYRYGYAWICLHINDFRPRMNPNKKDNILDLCQSLYNFIGDTEGIR